MIDFGESLFHGHLVRVMLDFPRANSATMLRLAIASDTNQRRLNQKFLLIQIMYIFLLRCRLSRNRKGCINRLKAVFTFIGAIAVILLVFVCCAR